MILSVPFFIKTISIYFSDYNCTDINVIYQRALHSEQTPLPLSTSCVCPLVGLLESNIERNACKFRVKTG